MPFHVDAPAKSGLIRIQADQLLALLCREHGWGLGVPHGPERLLDGLPVKPMQPFGDIHLSISSRRTGAALDQLRHHTGSK
jgi:hypothetical protein